MTSYFTLRHSRLGSAQATYLLAGILGTALFHRAQLFSGFDLIPGRMGDSRLLISLFEHWYQVFRGSATWDSPIMMYPQYGTIGFTDMVFGHGLLHSFYRMMGFDIFRATISALMTMTIFAYLSFGFLARKIFGVSWWAATVGSWYFAFNSIKFLNMGHFQVHFYFTLPILLCLILSPVKNYLWFKNLSFSRAFGFFSVTLGVWGFLLYSGWYLGWFLGFYAFFMVMALLAFPVGKTIVLSFARQHWKTGLASLLPFSFLMIPFFSVYLPARPYGVGIAAEIPTLDHLLSMSATNLVWGWLSTNYNLQPQSRMGFGLIPSIVVITSVGWAIGFLAASRKAKTRQDEDRLLSGQHLRLLCFAVTLLPVPIFIILFSKFPGEFTAWDLTSKTVPGAVAIRALFRYALILTLPTAMALAVGVDWLREKTVDIAAKVGKTSVGAMAILLILFAVAEQISHGFGFSRTGQIAHFTQLATQLNSDCRVLYVEPPVVSINTGSIDVIPDWNRKLQADAVILSAITRIPTVNGFSGINPVDWNLYDLYHPNYVNRIEEWRKNRGIQGTLCRVQLPPFSVKEISSH